MYDNIEPIEPVDPILRLMQAKPKETRRAALAFLYHLVSELDSNRPSALYALQRGIEGDPISLEEQDPTASSIEAFGALEGLCARLPALPPKKFATIFLDCLRLAPHAYVSPSDRAKAEKILRADFAGYVREALENKVKAEPVVEKGAVFSADRVYRYVLTRTWDSSKPRFITIALNPSTADESKDDPTIRRLIGFAKRAGCGTLVVLNAYAFRATDPAELDVQEAQGVDVVGPENDEHIRRQCRVEGALVVLAWGTNIHEGRANDVVSLVHGTGSKTHCFGVTKDGFPKHCLYLKAVTPLEVFK